MPLTTTEAGRTYAGQTHHERRRERRDRFVDAVIELVGTHGYPSLRVRALCRQAGLADRYFYEQFDTLEDALLATYASIMDDVLDTTLSSMQSAGGLSVHGQTRHAIAAFVHAATHDPRRARIQLLEVVGVSPRMEAERRATMARFSTLIADVVRDHVREPTTVAVDLDLTSVGLVGAVDELLVAWIHGEIDPDRERLIDALSTLFLRALVPPDT